MMKGISAADLCLLPSQSRTPMLRRNNG